MTGFAKTTFFAVAGMAAASVLLMVMRAQPDPAPASAANPPAPVNQLYRTSISADLMAVSYRRQQAAPAQTGLEVMYLGARSPAMAAQGQTYAGQLMTHYAADLADGGSTRIVIEELARQPHTSAH